MITGDWTLRFIANYANSGRTDGGYLRTYATFGLMEVLYLRRDSLTPEGIRRLRAELKERK